MSYQSINPTTGELLKEFPNDPFPDLSKSQTAFAAWKILKPENRVVYFESLRKIMELKTEELARLISMEMGKPFEEAKAEITKSCSAIQYYVEHGPQLLRDQPVPLAAKECYVRCEPLGIIFGIMPWNFPFWQLFRFAIPTMIAGNVIILKHSSNVPQCASAIVELFKSALPDNTFLNYFLDNKTAGEVLADARIAGLSFTGSNTTGSLLASLAGKNLKKVVMELGGNDPFIILEDADIPAAVSLAVKSRSINGGQACNGAKRFIPVKKIADEFTARLIESVQRLNVGDPFSAETNIGPLARKDLAEKVSEQVKKTVSQGAVPHYGKKTNLASENFVQPVVLTGVKPGMISFEEEVFGPVWSVTEAEDEEDAIRLANQSMFGLAAALMTRSLETAHRIIPQLETGNVYVNEFVRSNPYLPFGGVKESGFGRELGEQGIREFINLKSVFIQDH